MKKIEAYVKSRRLTEVIERLHLIDGLTGASVHAIRGFGRTRNAGGPVHIVDDTSEGVPHVKLEVFCCDALKEAVVEAVLDGGHTGLRADGKIYVSTVEEALRISTKERGEHAV
jgi:nitrogen regulatory protein PII